MKFTRVANTGLLVALAHAATHEVTVGPNLEYSPSSLTASQGDVVSFKFGSGHDVVSGSFDSPCKPDGKIYSGMPKDGDVFSVTVNSTDPIWIYCSVPHHCQGGMAMVINPPSAHTINDYKSAASNVGSSSAPSDVTGGVFGAASGSSASSSASSSATSSASVASSSGASSSGASATKTSSSTGTTTSSSAAASSSGAAASLGQSAATFGSVLGSIMAVLVLN